MLIFRRAVCQPELTMSAFVFSSPSYSFYMYYFNCFYFNEISTSVFQSDHKVLSVLSRGRTTTLKGSGCSTTPSRPCKLGSGAPLGSLKLIRCNSDDRKRKSSSLANDSPTQTRGPAPNGRKQEGVTRWPWLSIKRSEEVWKKRWQSG